MDRELQDYYENRFNTMSTKGWKDFIDDVQEVFNTYNKINSAETFEDFHKRKGQIDILQWILTLQQVSEQTYEDLKNEETV